MVDEMDQLKERERICSVQTTQDDCEAIIDHAKLLCVLTASDDAASCLAEMNRILWLISDHATAIRDRDLEEQRRKANIRLVR